MARGSKEQFASAGTATRGEGNDDLVVHVFVAVPCLWLACRAGCTIATFVIFL